MRKRGISAVVTIVLLIMLSLVAIATLWEVFNFVTAPTRSKINSGMGEIFGENQSKNTGVILEGTVGCSPDWKCSEGGECQALYDYDNVVSEEILAKGEVKKICEDKNGCYSSKVESAECDLAKSVNVVKVEEGYVEVYDSKTNELIAKLKQDDSEGFMKLDIGVVVN
jgi:hypothetical protein